MKEEKVSIIDQFLYSVMPQRYPKLIRQRGSSISIFVLVFVLFLTCITYIVPAVGWNISTGGVDNFIRYALPEISFKNGELNMDRKVMFGSKDYACIRFDTSIDKATAADLSENTIQEILVSKTNMLLKSGNTVNEVSFSQYKNLVLNNELLLQFKPMLYCMFGIYVVTGFCFRMVSYIFWAMLYAFIALGIQDAKGNRLTKKQAFLVGIYATVLMTLVSACNAVVQWVPQGYAWIFGCVLVNSIFVFRGTGFILMKNDKKQIHKGEDQWQR